MMTSRVLTNLDWKLPRFDKTFLQIRSFFGGRILGHKKCQLFLKYVSREIVGCKNIDELFGPELKVVLQFNVIKYYQVTMHFFLAIRFRWLRFDLTSFFPRSLKLFCTIFLSINTSQLVNINLIHTSKILVSSQYFYQNSSRNADLVLITYETSKSKYQPPKGQIISEAIFLIVNSSKKRTKNFCSSS